MVQYSLSFNVDRCIGCFTCEVACKQEHNLSAGPRLIHVIEVGPREVDGKLRMDFVPTTCVQCTKPPCVAVCPVEAITRDESKGVVLIDENLCIGCKMCLQACPFGVAQFDPYRGEAVKCDLCFKRIETGLKPSCVKHCPAEAITFMTLTQSSGNQRDTY